MGSYRRPFGRDDAVNARIAQRAVLGVLMAPKHGVQLGPEALDGPAARLIHEVCSQLYGDAAEAFERVREQKQLGFSIDRRLLNALRVSGAANLHPQVGRVDVQEIGHPDLL